MLKLAFMGDPEKHSSLLPAPLSDYFNQLCGLKLLQEQGLIHSCLIHSVNASGIYLKCWGV